MRYVSTRNFLGLADVSPVSVSLAEVNAASLDASKIFQFGIQHAEASISKFIRQLEQDIDGLRAVFPKGEVCMAGDVYEYLTDKLINLGNITLNAGRQLSQIGIRQFVREEYARVANDLNRDLNGKFGISAMLKTLLDLKAEASRRGVTLAQSSVCVVPKDGIDLHKRIFFSLGRIRIALETYAELEGFIPWFANNLIANMFFDSFFALGKFSVAVAKAINEPIDRLKKAFEDGRKATENFKEIIKIMSIAGSFVYAMHIVTKN